MLSLCDWLMSLGIHVVAWDRSPFLSEVAQCSVVRVYRILFIQTPTTDMQAVPTSRIW